jgi:hypothetical protein
MLTLPPIGIKECENNLMTVLKPGIMLGDACG